MERPATTSIGLITRPEAARRVGVGLQQIRRACQGGELHVDRIGGWSRVRWDEVVRWVESKRGCAGA